MRIRIGKFNIYLLTISLWLALKTISAPAVSSLFNSAEFKNKCIEEKKAMKINKERAVF